MAATHRRRWRVAPVHAVRVFLDPSGHVAVEELACVERARTRGAYTTVVANHHFGIVAGLDDRRLGESVGAARDGGHNKTAARFADELAGVGVPVVSGAAVWDSATGRLHFARATQRLLDEAVSCPHDHAHARFPLVEAARLYETVWRRFDRDIGLLSEEVPRA
mmetsp:Transcript_6341/g.26649  ORF Transcript_6341/g.26649 Transcript_6341/m.26649 type:complete len:164 (+) Transcript_6341:965-1456(+)